MLKFLLVVALFAGVVYALMWTIERRRAAGSGAERDLAHRSSPRPSPKVVAPDDDEDFLRWLDRKRRKDSPDS